MKGTPFVWIGMTEAIYDKWLEEEGVGFHPTFICPKCEDEAKKKKEEEEDYLPDLPKV